MWLDSKISLESMINRDYGGKKILHLDWTNEKISGDWWDVAFHFWEVIDKQGRSQKESRGTELESETS